jgi:hypothetical protein
MMLPSFFIFNDGFIVNKLTNWNLLKKLKFLKKIENGI